MKKHFLFIITLLFVFKAGQGQTNMYHPFPDSNVVWSNSQINYFCAEGNCCTGMCNIEYCPYSYQYLIKGDTIISGIIYNKVYRQALVSSPQLDTVIQSSGEMIFSCLPPVFSYGYFAGIRNDTLHKKVFSRSGYSDNKDTLLYDFSLAVGDTMRSGITNFVPLVLTSIDSVLINITYRRRFNFSGLQIIEGVGAVGGVPNVDLFLSGPLAEFNSWGFVCFKHDSDIYPTGSSCPLITNTLGVKQIINSNEQITIYPNPNNGSFVIESSNATKQTMQVYDVNGKMVLSQTINGKTTIDASSLNEGVYNISIISSEGVVNKRLVIVR